MSAVRKQAPRPAKPAGRYWTGKAPKGVVDVESDSDAEDIPSPAEEDDVLIGGEQDIVDEEGEDGIQLRAGSLKLAKAMNVSLKDVNISKDGKVIVAGREESGRTAMEGEADSEEDESDDDHRPQLRPQEKAESDESSEYETDSEEDGKPKLQFRPVFIPKRGRATIVEKESLMQDTEEALRKKEQEAEERRKQSHDLVAESIKRELAEKEKEELIPDVDDTDGLDPAGEFEAWRLRELGRIKKEKEDEILREEERAEIERRRALPEDLRLKEDLERAEKLREEKPKGKQKFLQKYWHKGAFHQDEEILQRHDYTEATESTIDVSVLPKVMQVKNFGKRSRTKYTHLLDQDTTVGTSSFGGIGAVKVGGKAVDGGSGCFVCGGPHLKIDCPQNTGPLSSRGPPMSRANAGQPHVSRDSGWRQRDDVRRKERDDDRGRYERDRGDYRHDNGDPRASDRDGEEPHRHQDSSRRRSRSLSRSRSPRRSSRRDSDRDRPDRRLSEVDPGYRDKRRRIN